MNSQLNLSDLRKTMNYSQNPYRVVECEQIQYVGRVGDDLGTQKEVDGVGKNVYRIDGHEILTTDYVSRQLDDLAGFDSAQRKTVRGCNLNCVKQG